MTVRMRMVLTIDVERPEGDIEEAFPPVRAALASIGLRPWRWKVDDIDAMEETARWNRQFRAPRRTTDNSKEE